MDYKGKLIEIDVPDGANIAKDCKTYFLQNDILDMLERPAWVYDTIQYNIFQFPRSSVLELFHWIRNRFWENAEIIGVNSNMPHFIQGWVNVFHSGEKINWHSHCPDYYPNMYHGVFCVSSPDDSYTIYAEPFDFETAHQNKDYSNINIIDEVKSIEGNCHIINDMTTPHKSTINNSDEPRITLAFDIVGFDYYENLWPRKSVNQYIPLV